MSIRQVVGSIKKRFKPASDPLTGPFLCPVCNTQTNMSALPAFYFSELQKYQYVHNIFLTETLNLEHYSCNNCGASDRDRLYVLFLEEISSE